MISFVLFSPVLPEWDRIVGMLALSYRTTGCCDVMFTAGEDAGWREFLHDLYPGHSRKRIERKCDDLSRYPRAVRIVACEGDAEKRHLVKVKIRERFAAQVPLDAYITIHSSDTDDEARLFWAMTHPMNLHHARRRVRMLPEFLSRLDLAKKELDRCGIARADACVVGGAVLEAMGIRKANDVDFIVPADMRGNASFDNGVDLARAGYSADFSDEEIIRDPKNHFWVNGLKFAAADIVAARKAASKRKKDAADAALMDAAG